MKKIEIRKAGSVKLTSSAITFYTALCNPTGPVYA
jgi:hypothetical protein